jgi:cell division protein FtsW (lipid II flippase)
VIGWRERRPFDYILLVSSIALTVYGLLLIYSGSISVVGRSPSDVLVGPVGRQGAFAIVGLTACIVVSRIDYRFLAQAAMGLYFGLIASLLFVLTVGTQIYGSKRWIDVGGTHIQPSEIGKLIVILVLAKYLTDNAERI